MLEHPKENRTESPDSVARRTCPHGCCSCPCARWAYFPGSAVPCPSDEQHRSRSSKPHSPTRSSSDSWRNVTQRKTNLGQQDCTVLAWRRAQVLPRSSCRSTMKKISPMRRKGFARKYSSFLLTKFMRQLAPPENNLKPCVLLTWNRLKQFTSSAKHQEYEFPRFWHDLL